MQRQDGNQERKHFGVNREGWCPVVQPMRRTVMIRAKWNYCSGCFLLFFFLHILTHHSSFIVITSDSLFHCLIWIDHSAIKLKAEHAWKQKKAIHWKIQFTWRTIPVSVLNIFLFAALKNIRIMSWAGLRGIPAPGSLREVEVSWHCVSPVL